MNTYIVEARGEVREIYVVEADSPEDAMLNWDQGTLIVSEALGVDPVSAILEE